MIFREKSLMKRRRVAWTFGGEGAREPHNFFFLLLFFPAKKEGKDRAQPIVFRG